MDFVLLIGIIYLGWTTGEKLTYLTKRIRKLERRENRGCDMSQLLKGLEGKQCKIQFDELLYYDRVYSVLEVDEEWVKLSWTDKKGVAITKLVRVDNIKEIEIVES
ncbi:hypothetical protein [Streptococcus respiraculi]|uniref:hypothetical protein n=1 Tax=Streptococcus respiraculi TaxID=2021971 RepID=UPI000E74DEF1|nr:hypothetical protein [Streptococcus respiraculi]